MKLLLDVHHSRRAAQRLRDQGHDVVAAADHESLRDLDDATLLEVATAQHRAVVTENVKDFDRIVREWAASEHHHAGVIFTSPRRSHRGSAAYPEDLISALGALLAAAPSSFADHIHWL